MNTSEFILPIETPIIFLDCEDTFNCLNEKEKKYAHYLSRASWLGGLIDLVQVSVESPIIFSLLHKLFAFDSVDTLKRLALQSCAFSEEEFTSFLMYSAGIYGNLGNYRGFGDTKFVPNLPKDKFEKLILSSNFATKFPKESQQLLSSCLEKVFSLEEKECRLGFPHKGTTTYLSKNITEEDRDAVKKFLTNQNIGACNTRLFKTRDETGKNCYEIRLASVLQTDSEEDNALLGTKSENGHSFVVTRGDYSKLLMLVNENLLLAKEYAANDYEKKMIEHYIASFHTGSLDNHKDGSRFWVKDKGPVVESYIGFIETYRDPIGVRAEFEGFVALVNKKMSVKFSDLVNSAEKLLPLLPWPQSFEKDKFLQPDFTSLDILSFACSMVPRGICIPNYDDIRQTEGFKNVSLGNVIHGVTNESTAFIRPEDKPLMLKYRTKAHEIKIALHELLGHGSGKLFTRNKEGTYNFNEKEVLNFETNEKISSWYEDAENYDSVFGTMGCSYEECRADSVALALSDVPDVFRIFGYEGTEADDIFYIIWLSFIWEGLTGLEMYDPKTNAWLQAHSQGRYVILQVLLEGGDDFVKIEKVKGADGKPDLLLIVDRSKIKTVGKSSIRKFLGKLQLYKATADVTSAKAMYDKYSSVSSEAKYPFLDYREIVMSQKKPRWIPVMSNTVIEDGQVKLKNYQPTMEGVIQSWTDRIQHGSIDGILEELWAKDKHHFL